MIMIDKIGVEIYGNFFILKKYIRSKFNNLNNEDLEDICGDAILRVWQMVCNKKIRLNGNIYALMKNCAYSIAIDFFKRNNRQKRILSDDYIYFFKIMEKSPEKQYENSRTIEAFLNRTNQLKDIHKKILILSLFQGMNHNEISEALNISRECVSSFLMRARQKLGNVHLNKTRDKTARITI